MSPPRNAPCPCGSGKKSKRCCGGPEAHNAREAERQAKAAEERRAHTFDPGNVGCADLSALPGDADGKVRVPVPPSMRRTSSRSLALALLLAGAVPPVRQ